MNVHVPQTVDAVAEVQVTSSPAALFVSAENAAPAMGLIQDSLLACWLLLQPGCLIRRERFFDFLMAIRYNVVLPPPTPAVLGKSLYTGAQLISACLPKHFNYENSNGAVVRDGVLCSVGTSSKSLMGRQNGGLIHAVAEAFSGRRAVQCLSDLQRVTCAWMQGCGGCSVTYQDSRGHDTDEVRKARTQVNEEVSRLTNAMETTEEPEMFVGLCRISAETTRNTTFTGGLASMISAGSKGGPMNIAQMAVGLGQMCLRGQRLHTTEKDILPSRPEGLAAHGFVSSSYCDGLSPVEYWCHMAAGREGVVDTAVKTAETGYIQRKLSKTLEDVRVAYDGSLRMGAEVMVAPCFNSAGYDPQHLYHVPDHLRRKLIRSTHSDFVRRLGSEWGDAVFDAREKWLMESRLTGTRHPLHVPFWYPPHPPHHDDIPVNISLTPPDLITQLHQAHCHHGRTPAATIIAAMEAVATAHPDKRASMAKWLCDCCTRRTLEPGTNIGLISAQSLGRPSTQLTLNAFHHAGAAKKGAGGLTRLVQLLDCRTSTVGEEEGEVKAQESKVPWMLLCDLHRCKWSATLDSDIASSWRIRVEQLQSGGKGQGAAYIYYTSPRNEDNDEHRTDDTAIADAMRKATCEAGAKWACVVGGMVVVCVEYGMPLIGEACERAVLCCRVPTTSTKIATLTDVTTAQTMLGIEAARRLLEVDMHKCLCQGGSFVHPGHFALCADVMAMSGRIEPATRHGMRRTKYGGVLHRASFEMTIKTLVQAASVKAHDNCQSNAAAVIFGRRTATGTGCVDYRMSETGHTHPPDTFVGWHDTKPLVRIDPEFAHVSDWDPDRLSPPPEKLRVDEWMDVRPLSPPAQVHSPKLHMTSTCSPQPASSTVYQPASPSYMPCVSASSPVYTPASPSYLPHTSDPTTLSPVYNPPQTSTTLSPVYTPTSLSYPPPKTSDPTHLSPVYTPTSPSYLPPTSDAPAPAPPSPIYS